jgi:DNA-directed RNA polymerase specialized sigma24 family protein
MEPNVSAIERRLERSARAASEQMCERDQAMCELRRLGVGLERISELARVSKGRVSQIVNRARQENAA